MKGIGTLKERIGDRSQEVASNSKPLEEVQQKNKQLRAILQRLAWPRLGFFTVHGITHNLPWPPKLKLLSAEQGPAIRTLRYLSGFFDGDGCVTCSGSLSGCTLSVRQSYDKAEVLVLLCKTFGGRVYKGQDGLGLRKPLLDWVICGAPARRCANLLAIHSIVKKKQLLLAASWPDDARRRPDCKASLHSLKLCDSAVAGPCTWEYVAGFFDAEGCLQLYNRSTLRLAIKQKFATVLHCLQEFLVESCDAGANIYAGNGYFALYISRTSACKTVLQIMLDAGLLIKKQNAELALNTTHENAAKVRLTLAELVGNQMFGRRLDDAGMNRVPKAARRPVPRDEQAGKIGGGISGAQMQVLTVTLDEQEALKKALAALQKEGRSAADMAAHTEARVREGHLVMMS
ncbi:unnamed protein product [Symbiodinium pilosum]|uniref:LAGLIDADG endonuclease n=1 Tax=Symbiodinium pilosum TaxID=2952 RepID=A0A812QGZ8_SYMPI|nr:unnamed protein product [Symbiodinium pilosum]